MSTCRARMALPTRRIKNSVARFRAVGAAASFALALWTGGCSSPPASPEATPAEPSAPSAAARPRAEPAGLIYAREACSSCHAVEAGGRQSPDSGAPSFEAIARTPGMTAMALNVWLRSSPHRRMPLIVVEPDQVEDLSAYLYSLRASPTAAP